MINILSFTGMQVTKWELKLRVNDTKSVGPWVCAKGQSFLFQKGKDRIVKQQSKKYKKDACVAVFALVPTPIMSIKPFEVPGFTPDQCTHTNLRRTLDGLTVRLDGLLNLSFARRVWLGNTQKWNEALESFSDQGEWDWYPFCAWDLQAQLRLRGNMLMERWTDDCVRSCLANGQKLAPTWFIMKNILRWVMRCDNLK